MRHDGDDRSIDRQEPLIEVSSVSLEQETHLEPILDVLAPLQVPDGAHGLPQQLIQLRVELFFVGGDGWWVRVR